MNYGMNGSTSSLRWTVIGLLAWGCGDDAPGGTGNDTDSDGTSTTMSGSESSTAPSTTGATDSATGESSSSSSEGSSSSGGPVGDVMLAGRTQDFIGTEAIPGSEISVFGMDTLTATADADGNFELGPLPGDMPIALVLEPITVEDVDYVGSIVPERTGTMDRDDVIAPQINQVIIDEQIMGIQKQMPEPANLEQAIVIVMVRRATGAMPFADGTVNVEMDPPPAPGTYYAPDDMGAPILDSGEIGYEFIPAAVFFNLPDAEPGDITVTAEHSVPTAWTCAVDHPEWPTRGSYTTIVYVTCAEA